MGQVESAEVNAMQNNREGWMELAELAAGQAGPGRHAIIQYLEIKPFRG
jgi:hypothetical protein